MENKYVPVAEMAIYQNVFPPLPVEYSWTTFSSVHFSSVQFLSILFLDHFPLYFHTLVIYNQLAPSKSYTEVQCCDQIYCTEYVQK